MSKTSSVHERREPIVKAGRTADAAATMVLRSGPGTSGSMISINLPAKTLEMVSLSPAAIKSIMKTMGSGMLRSRKSGRSSRFTVEVDPQGVPSVSALEIEAAPAVASSSDDDRIDQALVAARERGRLLSARILEGADMLSAEDFATRLGVSRVTVNARRQKHELLAIDGAKRGFRFPSWQVDDDGKAFEIMPRLFAILGPSPWAVYRFLTQRHAVLDGLVAREALRRGRTDLVIEAAESVARGDFA